MRRIPNPPTTWADELAWLLQVGWILVGTAYESLFTHLPQLDSLQFAVLVVVGAAMIALSVTISFLVFKEKNRRWLEQIKMVEPPPEPK